MRLQGRTAIVTSGGTGIGLACVQALSAQGATVASGSRRGTGEGALVHPLDIRDPDSVRAFVAKAESTLGPVDILVNAAGVTLIPTIEGHDPDEWANVIDTNLNGPFRMIHSVLPGMKARGRGVIINITSTAARNAAADHPVSRCP